MKTVVLLAALAVAPALHAQTQWKLATGYRAESFHTRNIVQFAQDVERASSGALRIEVHANNTLFKLGEIPQAVEGGKAEAGETIMTSLVREIPIAGADAVPFVVRSYADARRLWDLQRPLIEGHFAAKGLKALYAVPWPPQGLFSTAPRETPGTGYVLNANGFSHDAPFAVTSGPEYRLVVDLGDLDGTTTVLTTGLSGLPGSTHYADMVDPWVRGEYLPLPFSSAAVESAKTGQTSLEP